jgi:trigger factor
MQVTIETLADVSSLTRKMSFAVLEADVQAATKQQLQKLSKTVKLPGFRPGKVPLSMVEKNYGYSAFNDALNDQVIDAFAKAADEQKLRIAGRPSIAAIEGHANTEELAFTATFEVYPSIAFSDFKATQLETFQATVSDTDIEDTLTMLRKQRATYETADKVAEKGDKVVCDFLGKIEGVAFEGGTAQSFEFELGAGRMLPEFEAAASGIKVGETKTFDLTFPEDYPGEAVKGKTAQFEMTALSILAPKLPEVDADFARTMGFDDGDVAKLRADVKANLEREVKGRMRSRSKQAALDTLLVNATFDAPKALVEDECAAQKEQFKEQMKRQGMTGNMPDIPLDAFIEQSTKRVKLGLALGELIAQNKLQAKPEQVRQRIDEISASYQKPEEVAAWYFGSRERLQEVEAVVIEDNAVEWLISNCTTNVTTVPFKEVMAA